MLSLHNEAASLCDRLEWGDRRRGRTPKVQGGVCCHPKGHIWHRHYLPWHVWKWGSWGQSSYEPWRGSMTRTRVPSTYYVVGWYSHWCPRAFIIYLFNCGHTCLPLYNRNDFSWSIHFVASVGINREEERRQHSLCTPMPFGIVKLIISFSGTGKGGRYSQTKMFTFPALFPIADFYSHCCPETEAIYLGPIHKS